MIKHEPSFNVEHIEETYTRKDKVPIKYVCTTEIKDNNTPCDVFYRETPHPEFGNRYFAICRISTGSVVIMNADEVETYSFGAIQDKEGNFHYSRFRWDFKSIGDKFIDGGRAYVRSSSVADVTYFRVVNGEMVQGEPS